MKKHSTPAPFAVDIQTAAEMVGLSRGQFYKKYLDTGLVKTIKVGKRDRIIDVPELKAAYDELSAQLPRGSAKAAPEAAAP